jgi:uncharacterized RDD family membrane protein YckC
MPMDCPQCHNSEIDDLRVCLVCGYRLKEEMETQDTAKPEETRLDETFALPPEPSSSAATPELPPWRQELSERLKAVKEKREARNKAALPPIALQVPVEMPQSPRNAIAQLKPVSAAPRQRVPAPQQRVLEPLPPKSVIKDPKEVANLIDRAVSRKPVSEEKAGNPPVAIFSAPERGFNEDKLILLSRTLSGLIDLILVSLFTGIFIITADYVSGIFNLDYISCAIYGGLFFLIFFGYSIFFMASSTQTIGMMITDLRVVGVDGKRPLVRQIIVRYFAFLIALFVLGIGLGWSLFNSKSLCFHDLLSGTRVIRI